LDELGERLLSYFASETLTMNDIYQRHSVGTPFVRSNYKHVLAGLEAQNKIKVEPPANERPKRKGEVTFADSVQVTFPERS